MVLFRTFSLLTRMFQSCCASVVKRAGMITFQYGGKTYQRCGCVVATADCLAQDYWHSVQLVVRPACLALALILLNSSDLRHNSVQQTMLELVRHRFLHIVQIPKPSAEVRSVDWTASCFGASHSVEHAGAKPAHLNSEANSVSGCPIADSARMLRLGNHHGITICPKKLGVHTR